MIINPTAKITDSTKLNDYMTCPRLHLYRHVFGWNAVMPSKDLVFGIAWHEAMAFLLPAGYSNENVMQAYQIFLKIYREAFPNAEDDEELRAPKTPTNAFRMMLEYVVRYRDDDFTVLHTEIAGSVPINDSGRKLHFKIDNIIREQDGRVCVMERKTAGAGKVQSRVWTDQWALSMQVGTYAHVLHMLYPPNEVRGVYIDGVSFSNPPKRSTTEEKDPFNRMMISMPPQRMEAWLATANHWMECLEVDFECLESQTEDDTVLEAFPMNPVSCTKYWGCPFRDFCVQWQNPLRHCNEAPDSSWEVKFWDPRTNPDMKDGETKEVVELK